MSEQEIAEVSSHFSFSKQIFSENVVKSGKETRVLRLENI